jgi:hypothetical protein
MYSSPVAAETWDAAKRIDDHTADRLEREHAADFAARKREVDAAIASGA